VGRFLTFGLCLPTLLFVPAAAHAQAVTRILETSPASPAFLGRGQWLNIHITYSADQEVMFSPDASYRGQRVFDENRFLSSRFLPAGEGEAAVAVAFADSRKVDVVKVFAWSRSGKILGQTSLDVDVHWTSRANANAAPLPDWAHSLEGQQMDRARSEAAGQSWTFTRVLLGLIGGLVMFGSVPAYLALQVITVFRFTGGWLKAALLGLFQGQNPTTFLASDGNRRKCSAQACTPAFQPTLSKRCPCRGAPCGSMLPGAAGRSRSGKITLRVAPGQDPRWMLFALESSMPPGQLQLALSPYQRKLTDRWRLRRTAACSSLESPPKRVRIR
jgi:hypothetical protein